MINIVDNHWKKKSVAKVGNQVGTGELIATLKAKMPYDLWSLLQAVNFLVGSAQKPAFGELYEACIQLLAAGAHCEKQDNFSLLVSHVIEVKTSQF